MQHLGEVLRARGIELPDIWESLKEYLDLVGVAEIAERAGVQPDTVIKWRTRHDDFPEPVKTLAMGPVWHWPTLEEWIARQQTRGPGYRKGT